MKSLNIVGCGRVGRTLGRLWHSQGTFRVQDVLTGSKHTAIDAVEFIGQGHAVSTLAAMRAADLWMLAVPDRQIAQVADDLAQTTLARQHSALAFHCSGALTTSELSPIAGPGLASGQRALLAQFCQPTGCAAPVCRHTLRAGRHCQR
ncbi:MAG: NAD(P)-binding domain-containing protein [Rhodoferax sp.]|nr:NAD(P)-binding domain-containing protein [Rhodoferax sp.]